MNSRLRSIGTALVGITVLGTGLVLGQVTEALATEHHPTKAQLVSFKKFKKAKKFHHHKKFHSQKKWSPLVPVRTR